MSTASKLVVKVVEAHHVKAADVTGTSDPYVVIDYIPAGAPGPSAKQRTKTIPNQLAPVWNEEFVFDFGSDDDELLFTSFSSFRLLLMHRGVPLFAFYPHRVYDYDVISSDDFLGKAHVKVKDIHEGQYKDKWVLLEKRTKSDEGIRGKLHIEASVL